MASWAAFAERRFFLLKKAAVKTSTNEITSPAEEPKPSQSSFLCPPSIAALCLPHPRGPFLGPLLLHTGQLLRVYCSGLTWLPRPRSVCLQQTISEPGEGFSLCTVSINILPGGEKILKSALQVLAEVSQVVLEAVLCAGIKGWSSGRDRAGAGLAGNKGIQHLCKPCSRRKQEPCTPKCIKCI